MPPIRHHTPREVINSLTLKHYKTPTATTTMTASMTTDDGDVIEDVSLNGRDDNNDVACSPICFVDFTEGMEIRILPCGHEFSRDCIDPWLLDHATCPTCQQQIDITYPTLARRGVQ